LNRITARSCPDLYRGPRRVVDGGMKDNEDGEYKEGFGVQPRPVVVKGCVIAKKPLVDKNRSDLLTKTERNKTRNYELE